METLSRRRVPQNRRAAASQLEAIPIHSEAELSVISPTHAEVPDWGEEEWPEEWTEEDASMTSTRRKIAAKPKAKAKAKAGYPIEEKPVKVTSKTRSKADQQAATTGELAAFPLLGMTKSWDPCMNASWVFHQRMITHKWKVLVLQMRFREAMSAENIVWKRHSRWLAGLFATEIAAVWGHFGACVKTIRGPKGPVMFR